MRTSEAGGERERGGTGGGKRDGKKERDRGGGEGQGGRERGRESQEGEGEG